MYCDTYICPTCPAISEAEKLEAGLPVIGDIEVERTGADKRDVEVTCSATGSPVPALTLWRRAALGSEYEPLQVSLAPVLLVPLGSQSGMPHYHERLVRQTNLPNCPVHLICPTCL